MSEPTLADVFGTGAQKLVSGATTTEAGLFIPASVFTSAPSPVADFSTANPEALYVSLLTYQTNNLTEAQRVLDSTNRQVAIEYSGYDIIEDTASLNNFGRYAFAVLLYDQVTIPSIDADSF